jgi:glycosyltransferase involved in cell wall biosynthesis
VASGALTEVSGADGTSLMHPAVSVIVPTRARPALLLRALKSITAQQYEGCIESIVVFDQTGTKLPSIGSVPNRNVRAISNDRAPGLAGARNSGILAAEGELVAFCDDDDEWLPNKLAAQIAVMRTTSARTVSCGITISYRGREVVRLPRAETITFHDLLRARQTEVHPSTIVVDRRALLDEIGLVDEAIPGSYAEDYEWLLRAARVGSISAVRAPLARIHWHESSFFAARWETIVSALTYLLERYPEFASDRAGFSRICGQLAFASAGCNRPEDARKWARRALRLSLFQPRAYLALAVSARLLSAERVLRLAHTFGKGI